MPLEAWQSGPIEGVSRILMPAAHAIVQSKADISEHAAGLTIEELWTEPYGAASVGFHLRHVAGSIDRLLTYTKGEALTEGQFRFLKSERLANELPNDAQSLIDAAAASIDEMVRVIRATPEESLFEDRYVGRARLKTNVFGLLFHIAEHTQRHTGQIITTAKIVRRVSGGTK